VLLVCERGRVVVGWDRRRGRKDEHIGVSKLADVDCILVAV